MKKIEWKIYWIERRENDLRQMKECLQLFKETKKQFYMQMARVWGQQSSLAKLQLEKL